MARNASTAPPTLGELLRRTLDAQGMSQVDLAEHTGLTTKHINQIMQGVIGISPDCAVRIGRALGIPAQVWLALQGARLMWEADQLDPGPHEPAIGKVRAQRDAAAAEAAKVRRELEAVQAQRDGSSSSLWLTAQSLAGLAAFQLADNPDDPAWNLVNALAHQLRAFAASSRALHFTITGHAVCGFGEGLAEDERRRAMRGTSDETADVDCATCRAYIAGRRAGAGASAGGEAQ